MSSSGKGETGLRDYKPGSHGKDSNVGSRASIQGFKGVNTLHTELDLVFSLQELDIR